MFVHRSPSSLSFSPCAWQHLGFMKQLGEYWSSETPKVEKSKHITMNPMVPATPVASGHTQSESPILRGLCTPAQPGPGSSGLAPTPSRRGSTADAAGLPPTPAWLPTCPPLLLQSASPRKPCSLSPPSGLGASAFLLSMMFANLVDNVLVYNART